MIAIQAFRLSEAVDLCRCTVETVSGVGVDHGCRSRESGEGQSYSARRHPVPVTL